MIRQRLEDVFEQAAWRQPSVVLLDDLDHVMGAAVSPEHEHGPEALHRLQLAQSTSLPSSVYADALNVAIALRNYCRTQRQYK